MESYHNYALFEKRMRIPNSVALCEGYPLAVEAMCS